MRNKSKKGHLISLVVAIVLLGAGIGIGFGTNIFDSFADVKKTIHFDGVTILKAVILIALLIVINAILQLMFGFMKKKQAAWQPWEQ